MRNDGYRKAYEDAASELEGILKDQERIEERILSLRKTMNALATLICQHEGRDKDFTDYAAATLREAVDSTLTGDINLILITKKLPLTASEIRIELKELGGSCAEHSNPLATIYAILNRLAESGRAKETIKDGKRAWSAIDRAASLRSSLPAHLIQASPSIDWPLGTMKETGKK